MSDDWEDAETTTQRTVDLSKITRQTRPHILREVEGPDAPTEFMLDKAEVIVGRSSLADIRIVSEDLSRSHVRLTRRGHEFLIEDLKSRNGLLLNGIRIRSAILRDQDVLQLGSVVLVYMEGG